MGKTASEPAAACHACMRQTEREELLANREENRGNSADKRFALADLATRKLFQQRAKSARQDHQPGHD
ncbi:hypothetical protein QCE48_30330 [Caballeronia sp. LZ024]|jgi:hypothetical protein|nr:MULTISPECIES: hypothetical protein [unclassified Caballeronia]MDR5755066.1 hypothetical protein [Caballeronia sp. LZ024]MDR5845158.1 hypothetical protein [Caballeronia sp. LZ031]